VRQMKASKGKVQVALLPKKPAPEARKGVIAQATEADRLKFGERELYWLPSGGTRDSDLNLTKVEDLVGPWTMRTMGTIEELRAKYFEG
jgi:uncharacterized protein (DUF1697 family)